ncbi:hypothetical protein QBC35DRAFT_514155 [Podospora australis]|uniref:F-box domain-containing protein n=1 Tax=Podospora australis TaxID=1536484 RepID=A0AAN6WXD6_9PEZI|nr:hypothetical protein QBC35DRAFT_514155 [Podospora australis]
MDSLPVELVRLIFQYCDAPSVRTLRLGAMRYAFIGYEYLIPAHFTAVEWRDDVQRLHNIACHERLRGAIQSLAFNFSKLREDFVELDLNQHLSPDRLAMVDDFWYNVSWREEVSRDMAPFHTRRDTVEAALRRLPNLKALEVTFNKSPHTADGLGDLFEHYDLQACRIQDDDIAVETVTTVISALQNTRLDSLTVDHLPLRTFASPRARKIWFGSQAVFGNLSRLDLVITVPNDLGPSRLQRAVLSLGEVLQLSPNLTDLRLGFRRYPRHGSQKFHVQFDALFKNHLTLKKLKNLKLECMSCTETDLKQFLLRHSSTLERLRLGGRGLEAWGGISLSEGRWKSFFTSLRGKLTALKRLHLQGDFESGRLVRFKEKWAFRASTDEDWNPLDGPEFSGRDRPGDWVGYNQDSRELEKFLIDGGPWPILWGPAFTTPDFTSSPSPSPSPPLLSSDHQYALNGLSFGYQAAPMSSAAGQNGAHHGSDLPTSIISHRPHPSSAPLSGNV